METSDPWESSNNGAFADDDWGTASSTSDDWSGDFDTSDFAGLRPTPAAPLWMALAAAALGLALGAVALVTTGWATSLIGGSTALLAVFGWLSAGILSALGLATYQFKEIKRGSSAFYEPNPIVPSLRITTLALGALGVISTSFVFATWLARQ